MKPLTQLKGTSQQPQIYAFQRSKSDPQIFKINTLLARHNPCQILNGYWNWFYIAAASALDEKLEIYEMDLENATSQVDSLLGMYYESKLCIWCTSRGYDKLPRVGYS